MIDPRGINLSEFITKWYGPPDNGKRHTEGYSHIPTPLAEWHDLAAQWSIDLVTLKKFTPLAEITVRDGKAVFASDPSDAIWAFDPVSPMDVFEGRLYGEWVKLTERLPEFLAHNLLGETAYNAPNVRFCDSVQNGRISEVLAPMTEVSFGGWNWPGPDYRIFLGDGIIAEVGPALKDGAALTDISGHSEVHVGAISESALSYLSEIPGTDWF
ncbi:MULTISPECIES: hypothetical protein [unclassified Streptomyces]|uniref:hypothetical protein n=1 Tax=unclassified Streptomyces TaxID=2593676 RepID=UPI00225B0B0A|nr:MULTISPECIES: hypothetical protein [unclassified Streptomyces]MCX5338237.1 hypothetical protein [Streptomyces sp. NBC_00140]MCX5367372.1 hypothetical protein [Streptomyces sp. NBC_00124]